MKTFSNYSLCLYTDLLFGKDTELQTGSMVRKHGGSKVLIVYGGGSIIKSGLYGRIIASLKNEGIPYVELPGVKANPRRSLINKGIELAKAEGVDFVLAVGGGSVIDSAKSLAIGACYDGDFWDFHSGKAVVTANKLPVGTVHTISAAGSEMSTNSVVLDDIDAHVKRSCNSPLNRPVFAIMNPELTYSVSKYQTGAGASDVFAHTLERYFFRNHCALGDSFAEGLLRTTVTYGPIAVREPEDYESHAELMLCGAFSHNDITHIGHSGSRGGPHSLESQLSGRFDTTHGAGLAVIMPAWLQGLVDMGGEEAVLRVAQLAINVFGVTADTSDMKAVANEGIERFRNWLASLGMPKTLTELLNLADGEQEAMVADLTEHARYTDGVLAGYIDFTKGQVEQIYRSAI